MKPNYTGKFAHLYDAGTVGKNQHWLMVFTPDPDDKAVDKSRINHLGQDRVWLFVSLETPGTMIDRVNLDDEGEVSRVAGVRVKPMPKEADNETHN